MKYIIFALLLVVFANFSYAQKDSSQVVQDSTIYRVIKTDGNDHIGYIVSKDAREVLLRTIEGREFYIPQHLIEEIVEVEQNQYNSQGDFVGEDRFATRYFITTNGLPIKKGDHYIQWNLFGPDFQFGLGDNFGVGVMTSWLGMPIIGTIKKSWEFGEKSQFAIGGLAGTGTWIAPELGGVLPFATLSHGTRKANIAFSGGYGAVWFGNGLEGRSILSAAGMVKVGRNVSLVFDSFILPPKTEVETVTYTEQVYDPKTGTWTDQQVTNTHRRWRGGFALLIPGVRIHVRERTALQFGFTGIVADGNLVPFPIPMFQVYQSLR